MRRLCLPLLVGVSIFAAGPAMASWGSWFSFGLNNEAREELHVAGVDKYLGEFTPASSEDIGEGWVRHRFDANQNGSLQGPMCISGTEYSVFTKLKNPRKLLIFAQGGGACWQGFYECNEIVDMPLQLPPPPPVGVWSDDGLDTPFGNIPNPLSDYSIVFLPYCDGSVFTGDNDVVDQEFPSGEVRYHRGLRNLSAGMDLARDMFPRPRRIVVAGSSAGGVGAASFAPFLARMLYGNFRDLAVLNDAGPNAINLLDVAAIMIRASDWKFGQFYPSSCTECDDTGQGTAIVKWRLDNDNTIREGFYSTDGDATNRFFMRVPTQSLYRELILSVHGELNDAHPFRYKRFIQSGSNTHTAIQTPLYYIGTANGVPLVLWVTDFIEPPLIRLLKALRDGRLPLWLDAVDDFVPIPQQ